MSRNAAGVQHAPKYLRSCNEGSKGRAITAPQPTSAIVCTESGWVERCQVQPAISTNETHLVSCYGPGRQLAIHAKGLLLGWGELGDVDLVSADSRDMSSQCSHDLSLNLTYRRTSELAAWRAGLSTRVQCRLAGPRYPSPGQSMPPYFAARLIPSNVFERGSVYAHV